jgi:pyruvate dehydrogenase (quinone)
VPDFAYAEYARMLGLEGIRVDSADQVADAWERALQAGRPCVLEMLTDPNVPPMPPHVTRMQANKYFSAIEQGDDEAEAVRRALEVQGGQD